MQALGYPLPMNDRIREITEARNIELGLGLQVKNHQSTLSYFPSFLLSLTYLVFTTALLLASFKAQVPTPAVLFRAARIRRPEDPGHSNGGAFVNEAPRRTWEVASREASAFVDEQILRSVSEGEASSQLYNLLGGGS